MEARWRARQEKILMAKNIKDWTGLNSEALLREQHKTEDGLPGLSPTLCKKTVPQEEEDHKAVTTVLCYAHCLK